MSQPYIDFAHVKENASFERVLADYNMPMTGHGAQRTVLCPFHRERRPSCKIELERKIFHCFGCDAKGNILEFVAKLDRTDLRTAALKIATVCQIAPAPARERDKPAPEKPPAPKASAPRDTKRASPALPARKPAAQPAGGREAATGPVNPPLTFALKLDPDHPYLEERGVSPELVEEFGLGFCDRGLMKGCVCIPIHGATGALVAYAGRWPGEDVPEGEGKYKLPPKFEKSRVLFNLHRIEAGTAHLVLVEGFWSVFRLHALGVPVVGLMGWSISPEQVRLLEERGVRFLTLLLDGDEAGYQARDRLLPELASAFSVHAPKLPEGEKPDTLPEAMLAELVAHPATA